MQRKTIDDLLSEARASLRRLTPREAYAALQRGSVLIDTRSDDERARHGRIPGALPIPLSVLEWRVDPVSAHRAAASIETDAHVVLICKQGYSSSLAALRLQQIGFLDATDVIGGFEAWEEEGLPVDRGG